MNAIERILNDPDLAPGIKEWVKPARWYRYFHQDRHWVPEGRPAVEIAQMDASWRYNCTRYLERNALSYARRYSDGCRAEELLLTLTGTTLGEVPEAVLDHLEACAYEAKADPVAWIKTTPLYRALAAELPTKGKALRKLGERSRHWGDCPRRTALGAPECTCSALAARHRLEKERRELELAEATRPWE